MSENGILLQRLLGTGSPNVEDRRGESMPSLGAGVMSTRPYVWPPADLMQIERNARGNLADALGIRAIGNLQPNQQSFWPSRPFSFDDALRALAPRSQQPMM